MPSRRSPSVYLFDDGGGLVTRCHDVATARRLLVTTYLEDNLGATLSDADREELAYAARGFRPHLARVGHGRLVPARPEEDIAYWWHPGEGHIGQAGVTRAVWWTPI